MPLFLFVWECRSNKPVSSTNRQDGTVTRLWFDFRPTPAPLLIGHRTPDRRLVLRRCDSECRWQSSRVVVTWTSFTTFWRKFSIVEGNFLHVSTLVHVHVSSRTWHSTSVRETLGLVSWLPFGRSRPSVVPWMCCVDTPSLGESLRDRSGRPQPDRTASARHCPLNPLCGTSLGFC